MTISSIKITSCTPASPVVKTSFVFFFFTHPCNLVAALVAFATLSALVPALVLQHYFDFQKLMLF
jgi:hypothetical protein